MFGLLIEVTGEVPDYGCFVQNADDDEPTLTTSALKGVLSAWVLRTGVLDNTLRFEEGRRVSTLLTEVTELLWFFDSYMTTGQQLPSHVLPCIGPCNSVEPTLSDVIALIEEGSIPLLYFVRRPLRPPVHNRHGNGAGQNTAKYILGLDVRKYQPDDENIALSHVFAEGTGNTVGNYLPECRIRQIWSILRGQVMLEDKGKDRRLDALDLPAFWMDTLCVPVDPQHQRVRNLAIGQMHAIYKNALRVVVLSAETCALDRPRVNEILAKTFLSGWMQRLWTLQEGSVNPCLGVVIDLGLIFHIWDPEFCHGRDICHEIHGSLRQALENQLLSASLDHRVHDSTVERDRAREQRVFIAFKDRFASRKDDETICIATFLGLDPAPLLAVPTTKRMPMLLQMLPHVPDNILFAGGPRLEEPGFRWAPQTLLAPFGTSGIVSGTLHGRFDGGETKVRPGNVLTPEGILTTHPSLRLYRGPDPFPSLIEDSLFVVVERQVYTMSLMNDDWDSFGQRALDAGKEKNLVVLLALIFGQSSLGTRQHAVLVALDDNVADGLDGITKARYCFRVGFTVFEKIDASNPTWRPPSAQSKNAKAEWVPPRRWLMTEEGRSFCQEVKQQRKRPWLRYHAHRLLM
ncbi:hypothetical protein LTR97_001871 [Elasticomyces elasticus]|uniref:Heterokaryon incompatibility domain-containing protein n=1 Tax=Elasticomyces elasticus TaxID=574655 RepID=A0AAN7WGQ1_9PEZI|nr:hypothetical protein LTR97_001871 [Elasticomyces elasticus]